VSDEILNDIAAEMANKPEPPKTNRTWTSRKMDYIDAANLRLPGAPFKVAVCILNHANQRTEKAWPSQETIALRTGLNVRTVERAVGEIVKIGWIGRHTVWTNGKKRNIYTVLWRNVQAAIDELAEVRLAKKRAPLKTKASSLCV
jgi:hypothetical protein